MKKILIYRDNGANSFGVSSIHSSLCIEGIDRHYSIEWADKELLRTKNWIKDTHVLIFPGGRDIPYHEALQGEPNQYIREFVENGGHYFGICAGSYYGCAFIEFEKGHPLEVIADRELKFFPGIARGPAYGNGTFSYHNESGARIASLKLSPSLSDSEASAAYYDGGCAFIETDKYLNTQVLGSYSEIEGQPAAIIQCRVGNGRALLCGVHPEYSTLHRASKKLLSEDKYTNLQSIEQKRRQLFADLLRSIDLKF
ncbi:MAG: hypothetical protein H0U49_07255 [Parachlamydiaceae bacterium]|nr:hypothetical protein [Parachlamydiaceae bacterium]